MKSEFEKAAQSKQQMEAGLRNRDAIIEEGRKASEEGKPKAKGDREPIPIKKIVLQSGVNADFPGKSGAHALETGTQSGKTYAITYEPWARRYVVVYRRAEETPETVWVPEAWAMAYPA
jgi:hypothetical protein